MIWSQQDQVPAAASANSASGTSMDALVSAALAYRHLEQEVSSMVIADSTYVIGPTI